MQLEWVELQKRIKTIFSIAQVKKFKDVLQKDANGWNWILSFHELRTDTTLVLHTKIIFKLDKDKKFLRKNEFLYLKEFPCKFKIIKFSSLGNLENILDQIFSQSMFGDNSMILNELLVDPEMEINNYFSSNSISGYTVFEFEYIPGDALKSCQKLILKFKVNVNNNQDFEFYIRKKNKFEIIFDYAGKKKIVKQESLKNLVEIIAKFIVNNLDIS
jgi:hypothetical protein